MIHVEGMIRQSYPSIYNSLPSIALRPCLTLLKKLFHEKEVNTFLIKHERLTGLDFVETMVIGGCP